MRFNFLNKVAKKTTNHENELAYSISPELELYTAVVTFGLNDSFYESGCNRLERVKSLMAKCNPEFIAKLAVYTRTQMHLRSISLVLTVELAKLNSGNNLVKKTVNSVILRADEITELLAYYAISNNRTEAKKLNRLSKQLQLGLSASFNRFDEYQFSKYKQDKAVVKLKDALFLVHPKAKNEDQQVIFNKIANNSLAVPYTWETELSSIGQNKFKNEEERNIAFKKCWEQLIDSGKIGYMALLRNLRNLLLANVSSVHIKIVAERISNKDEVKKSKQLPFRFLSAYREIKNINSFYTGILLDSLEKAVKITADQIQGFDIDTSLVIACDVSGSMQKPISARSKVQLYDIGLILGMLLQSKCKNVVTGMFGSDWKIITMPVSNILENVHEFYKREGEVGYSTNGHLVVEDLYKRKVIVDKIMIFTDIQMWNSTYSFGNFETSWKKYKSIAPKAELYLFDLAGYGNSPVNIEDNDVFLIAGWSDKIFNVLNAIKEGNNALLKINEIVL